MAGRTPDQALAHAVELRRVRQTVADPDGRRRLGRVIRDVRASIGVGVPKGRAATLLGVSVQALERWVRNGAIPIVRKPGSSRELIDAEALLIVAEEVGRLREQGVKRGALAEALRRLNADERLPRKLRPNQSAADLRHEYLHTTPAERLRAAAELGELASALAGRAKAGS
jgi:DNA-binding transcriptional MerR regulator